jgi:putative cell wall-binding protein
MRRLTRTAAAAAVALAVTVPATAAHAAPGFDPIAATARAAGTDRYDTAAKIAFQSWAGVTGGTVIVANGETNGIDALSASYLAGFRDAPILLTARDAVPAPTAAAIAKLAPAHVIVIGAEASVSAATYATLTAGREGDRIGGVDRYDTAARVAAFAAPIDPTNGTGYRPHTVFLARGDKAGVAADALAAAPAAYRGHIPILLTARDGLPEASRFTLTGIQPANLAVLGDYDSIDAFTISQAQGAAGGYRQGHVPPVNRFSGANRSETAAAIAESFVARDAGIGGGYPILLAPSRDDAGNGTRAYVTAHQDTLSIARVFGDERSLTDAALIPLRSPATP